MATSGQKLTAMTTNSFTEATGATSGTTVYIPLGATCGIAFIAPATGRVMIYFSSASFNSGANDTKTSIAVRSGSTVGAGAVFLAALDNNMIIFNGTPAARGTSFVDVSGLVAGNTYNAQMEHKVSGGSGTWLYRSLSVVPTI